MGASRSRIGTSIAVKHALSMGKSKVKLAVISVTKMIPVTGARTTAVKNAAMPTTPSAVGSVSYTHLTLPTILRV